MSHIILTQIKDELEEPIVVKVEDISYSNPASGGLTGTFINLTKSNNNNCSIRVKESAVDIQVLIREEAVIYHDHGEVTLNVTSLG